MKMKTVQSEMELRETYWKCKVCQKIYVKAEIKDDASLVCPVCDSTDILPITVFRVAKSTIRGEEDDEDKKGRNG